MNTSNSAFAQQYGPRAIVTEASEGVCGSFAKEPARRGGHGILVARSGFAGRSRMHMARAGDPQVVARGSLDALGRKGAVRPGFLARRPGWSLALAPR